MITDAELILGVVVLVAGIIAFGVLWHIAKKDGENYVDVEDWK